MSPDDVLSIGPPDGPIARAVRAILARYGLAITWVADDAPITGTFFGDREAGLVGSRLYVRRDTPVHSALHEGCHWICADETRRATVDADIGGDDLEECAVCYLSVVLADEIPGCGAERLLADMDAWGYSYRCGSARAWFTTDAADAREWLEARGLPARCSVAPAAIQAPRVFTRE